VYSQICLRIARSLPMGSGDTAGRFLWTSGVRNYVELLEDGWWQFLQRDLAGSTHKAYGYHQQQYRAFCRLMGRPERPDAHTLAQFVMGRADHGYALSTIEQGVYAVQRWGLDLGVEALAADREVQRALKVAARLAVPGQQKLPLDRRDLRKVVAELAGWGPSNYIGVRDRALFLVGWAGMFRSSELVGVRWEHVRFTRKGVLIYLPRSKTDQAGKGAWVFIAACPDDGLMCPVLALKWLREFYIQQGESGQTGPVFRGRGGVRVRLAKNTVATRLWKALQRVGVRGWQCYAAHSLRRGGATWAVRQGLSLRQVQVMGRWQSDVVREYLYCSAEAMWAASARQQRG
jgi:integrase